MSDKTILITGCSSGIGYYAAKKLNESGYQVFATARKISDVQKLINEGLDAYQLDVTDILSIEDTLDKILKKTNGKLYAVFNNAGFLQAGAIADLSQEMLLSQFATNVFGPFEITRRVLPIMQKQGYGRIIQNSSILGVITIPYYGAYNASKFALEGFSNTLRQELHGSNIFVSLLNPGPITSNLRENAYQQYEKTLKNRSSSNYQSIYKKLENTYFKSNQKNSRFSQGPEAVFKKLLHALESPSPKAHYYIGFTAKLMATLKRFLPEKILDAILIKAS